MNTNSERPETHKKYRVSGTLVIDQVNREAYLIEQNIVPIVPVTDTDNDGINDDADPCPNEWGPIENNGCPKKIDPIVYIIIGGVLLLVALIIVLIVISMKKRKPAQIIPPSSSPRPSPRPEPRPSPGSGPGTMPSSVNRNTEYQTIKIQTNAAPKTMKLMPGYLEITAGADTGKKFTIAGYPTSKGSIVTIGREPVEGDRKYAHIQLTERTVSRQQAEIVAVGGNLEIKNLSKVNHTQLNGIEIQPGHKMPLEPDSIIKTGEVEFTYREK